MTPEQALTILDQAASIAALPRKDHELVLTALKTLRDATAKPVTESAPVAPAA